MATSWLESPVGIVKRSCSVRRTFASSSLIARVPSFTDALGHHALFEGLAKPVRRINAQDFQRLRLRDELQFLKRQFKRALLWVALHVGIELSGGEIAVDHVAFELGH